MIPKHYFDVICCSKCKSDLIASTETELTCTYCKAKYPVVDDIPIILNNPKDEVTQLVKKFYDSEWKRNENSILKASVKHDDMSNLGQKYVQTNEERFVSLFSRHGGKFFLDTGSGACPRTQFSKEYSYHVCLDLSLDGLIESRKLLGERAICVVGSLLELPIKESVCDGIICSHCLYHIDKDLQPQAIAELSRVLERSKRMLIFYANPDAIEKLSLWGVEKMKRILSRDNDKKQKGDEPKCVYNNLYYYAHPVRSMLDILFSNFPKSNITVRPLRMFTTRITKPIFKSKLWGSVFYEMFTFGEKSFLSKRGARLASYVCYIVKK